MQLLVKSGNRKQGNVKCVFLGETCTLSADDQALLSLLLNKYSDPGGG